ncbi:MAG: DsbA family protein [Armatimonadota bacterium]|nr:DsbA family protein [bacterium]
MNQEAATSRLVRAVDERDHVQGPSTALVTLVEYGDYECPYTKQAQSVIKGVQRRSGDWLRFVYRQFPKAYKHKHAEAAAEAAEAAGAQGMFWEVHDYLFDHQDKLDDASLMEYAEFLGLDSDQFERDLTSHAYAECVQDDINSGKSSGVEETPAFFINDRKYEGPTEIDAMLQAIQEAAEDISED